MGCRFGKILLVVMFVFIFSSTPCWAVGSGGYRTELSGSEALGKGSAYIAEADGPSSVYFNPAAMTRLEDGNHLEVGYQVLQPQISYENAAGVESQMVGETFFIPNAYFVTDLGFERFSFGMGATGNWGLGTKWNDDSFSRYVATETDLVNQDVMLAVGYAANDALSFGAAVDYDNSKVSKNKKLLQSGAGDDANFQLKGHDDGWGYRLSTHYQMNEKHSFGLQYRSLVKVQYEGEVYLDGLNNAGATPYAVIFGGSSFSVDLKSESTLPQSVVAGYSFAPNEKWRINFDVEWMDWSSVEQELLVYEDPLTANQYGVLNNGNPAARDWNDAWSAGLGAEYAMRDDLRLRGGYFFQETPIGDDNFESNLPDSDRHNATVGFGYDLKDDMTLNMNYCAMFYVERDVATKYGSGTINGTYKNFTQFLGASLGYKF